MRRRVLALTVAPLLVLGAACGSGGSTASPSTDTSSGSPSASSSATSGSIDGVTVSGDVGKEPDVSIDAPLKLDETQSEVLAKGDGAPVVEGKQALLHIYVANGTTGKKAAATYDQGAPAAVPMSKDQFFPAVLDAVVGKPSGSRVVVAAVPKDAYGSSGMKQIGLGGKDDVVFVVDVMSAPPAKVLNKPQGEKTDAPASLPTVEQKSGKVTGLDFSHAAKKPSKKLQVIPLVKGTGPPARADSLVTFNYLGQVYGSKKVFDESFSKKPVTFPLGTGQLIKAWDQGLAGVKRGSRVLIIAPPKYGYGPSGNQQAGIKGTDTLAFVVDVLGVS